MFPLLNNVNVEVSSNENDEVDSRMAVAIRLSNDVTHYASHCQCANVQFSTIEKFMQSMKIDPFIFYMVPYHNQKVL